MAKTNPKQTVAVLGASAKPERHSNQAVEMLFEYGYEVIPVNPAGQMIHGLESVRKLSDIKSGIHTLTIYVNPEISSGLRDEIIRLNPVRVIFNPGAENPEVEDFCLKNGIEVIRACTLVLLRTGQF